MKKTLLRAMLTILLLAPVISCNHDDDTVITPLSQDISGQWNFILSPGQVYNDTTLINGKRGSDFEVYASSYDEVYLNQTGTLVTGSFGPMQLVGTVNGNQVTIQVYDHPQGKYVKDRPRSEMVYLSDFNLQINQDRTLSGTGTYQPSQVYPDMVKNTLTVQATRIPTGTKSASGQAAVNNWEDDMCRVLSTISSWVISGLTDGIVRPMSSNCWLYHDGGGYFLFGHEGPGSILPVFTTTMYYPFEKSLCHCREYGFNISLGGENLTYAALKDLFMNHAPIVNLAAKMGFSDIAELIAAMDDFYAATGEFAISLFYNTNTGSITIYANTQNGDRDAAVNTALLQSLANAFAPHASAVYIHSGNSINDNFYLRRSPAFVCNTPIVVVYLFGTNKAEYN